MSDLEYWREVISIAADECELLIEPGQLEYLADAASSGHEHYSMAFYSPPPSERMDAIEGEWKRKLAAMQAEFDAYRDNAETAVKRALKTHHDAHVTIEKYGDVLMHGGRTEQIQ